MDLMSMFKGKSVSKNLALASSLLNALEIEFNNEDTEEFQTKFHKFRGGSSSLLKSIAKGCELVANYKEPVLDVVDTIISDTEKTERVVKVLKDSAVNILEVLSEVTRK